MGKICKVCKQSKDVKFFKRNHKTTDGYLKTCDACIVAKKKPRLSLRKGIDMKCKDCIYDPYSGTGTWREQVESCSSGNCPLYEIRPIAGKKDEDGDD